jgi:hypothetical protein
LKKHKFIILTFWVVFLVSITTVYGQDNSTYIKKVADFQYGNVNAIYDLYVGDTGLLYLGTDKGG